MSTIKTIGVLTSGGDAPGMNAAIRAVVRSATAANVRVLGVRKGYNGLMNGDMVELGPRNVSDILQKGGTILQTARCLEFKDEAGVKKGIENAKKFGLDGLIVIGGDGSFRGGRDLSNMGFPTICMPGTIDNDISCTEYCIGFDTALNTAQESVDKLRDTSTSHERCSVVEVMGHGAGYIALYVSISCGGEVCLIPEKPFDYDKDVLQPILEGKERGKQHDIVVVSEGVCNSMDLAKRIEKDTGIESRATILGHVQRGGSPTLRDRLVASQMGYEAVKALLEGRSNRVVVMQKGKIFDIDITEALNMPKVVDEEMIKLAKILSL